MIGPDDALRASLAAQPDERPCGSCPGDCPRYRHLAWRRYIAEGKPDAAGPCQDHYRCYAWAPRGRRR